MGGKRWRLAALAVIIVVCAFIAYRYMQLGKKADADRLCMMAEDYHMHCVRLASPTIYDHGAYIRLDPTTKDTKEISLPSDYIFSEQCSFAPATTAFAQFREDPTQYVAFGSHVFHIDRHLSAGVELNLPRIAGLSVKAGPKVSDLRSVTLEAESARYFNIDTRAFLNALSGCSVRPACASAVKLPDVHVIKRLLVAKNLKYRVETTSGESESFAAAVRSKNLSVGMDANSSVASIDDLSSGKDMVFAVAFFDPTELQTATISRTTGDTTRTVGLYQRTLVDPGTRWLRDSRLKEIPGSLKVWATPKASIKNEVEVTLVNELEETKILVASAKLEVNTSKSLLGKLPMYSYFRPLTLISQDGTQHQVPPVWTSNDKVKEFELGQMKPGEVVKVRIGRTLESVGRTDSDAGTIQEDLSITFSLR